MLQCSMSVKYGIIRLNNCCCNLIKINCTFGLTFKIKTVAWKFIPQQFWVYISLKWFTISFGSLLHVMCYLHFDNGVSNSRCNGSCYRNEICTYCGAQEIWYPKNWVPALNFFHEEQKFLGNIKK
jgi:hypothetical protein